MFGGVSTRGQVGIAVELPPNSFNPEPGTRVRVATAAADSRSRKAEDYTVGYRNLQECLRDLEAARQLVRLEEPIDAHLEAAEIQRRVYAARGPAVLFTNVTHCRFPMVSNLFGTIERARYLFRDTLD